MRKPAARFFVQSAILIVLASRLSASGYVIRDLGVVEGDSDSWSIGISASGQVIGNSVIGASDARGGFLWTEDTGLVNIRVRDSLDYLYAINDDGEIAGGRCTQDLGQTAVIRDSYGNLQFLPSISEGSLTRALGINNAHQAVGQSGRYAVLWESGGIVPIAGEGDDISGVAAVAVDINILGEAVGSCCSYTADGMSGETAFRWSRTGGLVALRALPGTTGTSACAINSAGKIVGYSGNHAVCWGIDGVPVDLGIASVSDINDQGLIVGQRDGSAQLWNADGAAIELPSLVDGGWASAFGINKLGQVVGSASLADGHTHAVLWQPLPEPSAIMVLICGLGILAGHAGRRQAK